MVQTVRSINDLLTNIFPDGLAAKSISAENIRDLIVSLQVIHGGMYISTPVETIIGAVSTPVKALGTTTITAGASSSITMPANNRLVYDEAVVGLPNRTTSCNRLLIMVREGWSGKTNRV